MSLRPNTTYYYRVKAINDTQESGFSDTISVTTLSSTDTLTTPTTASAPRLYKTIAGFGKADILLELLPTNEVIRELKVTISTNSDFSSPLYNELTYVVDKNTNYAIDEGNRYLVFTVTNLAAETTYYVRIRASNSVGISNALTLNFTTTSSVEAPVAIGATDLTAITARVNWNAINGATEYVFDVSTNVNFSTFILNNQSAGTNLYYDLPTLIENTQYFLRVRAKIGSTFSPYSNIVSFTTLEATETYSGITIQVSAPTIRNIYNLNTTEFSLDWNSVKDATSYELDISTSAVFASFVLQVNNITSTNYTITGLNAGTIYYVRVRAVHPSANSSYSSTVITTLTVGSALNPVQALTPTIVLSTSFVLQWVKRTYANRYLVQVSTSNTFSSILKHLYVGDVDSLVIDGLNTATIYYARIYALNSTQVSPVSNTVSLTTDSILPTITLDTPTDASSSSITLNWNTNAAYSSYNVSVYRKFGDGSFIGKGKFNKLAVGNVNSYTIRTFLSPGETYNYIVQGVTSDGDTNNSVLGEFTLKNTAPLLQLGNIGQYIEWSGNLNRLEASTDKDFKFVERGWSARTVNDTTKRFDISNLLKSNLNYYLRGYYVDESVSEYSAPVSTFNVNPLLLKPEIQKTSVTFTWKKGISNSYAIQVKEDNGSGSFIPITGHSFPVIVGDVDKYIVSNIDADKLHTVSIFQYNTLTNIYELVGLPYEFKTNKYGNINELTENGALAVPSVSLNNAEFDRFNINLPNTYTNYLVIVSVRSDFLTIESYIESSSSFTYIGKPNTTYYVRIYGVSGTDRTSVVSASILTSALPSLPSAVESAATLTLVSIINENEALVSWSAISNTTGYTLEISKTNSFNLLETGLTIDYIDTTKAVISGLSGILTYYARVYGYNSNSLSAYSNIVTIDTTP